MVAERSDRPSSTRSSANSASPSRSSSTCDRVRLPGGRDPTAWGKHRLGGHPKPASRGHLNRQQAGLEPSRSRLPRSAHVKVVGTRADGPVRSMAHGCDFRGGLPSWRKPNSSRPRSTLRASSRIWDWTPSSRSSEPPNGSSSSRTAVARSAAGSGAPSSEGFPTASSTASSRRGFSSSRSPICIGGPAIGSRVFEEGAANRINRAPPDAQ
jgi:hypothetical protein